MANRRSRGDGGLHWSEPRQRWIATASLGYAPDGRRIVKRGSGKTKATAKAKLAEVLRDHEDGLAIAPTGYTVANAMNDWLSCGLNGRDKGTISTCTILNNTHHPFPGRQEAPRPERRGRREIARGEGNNTQHAHPLEPALVSESCD